MARKELSRWSLTKLTTLQRRRQFQSVFTLVAAILGPVLAVATYTVFGPFDLGSQSRILRFVLTADLIYVMLITAFVILRIFSIISQRRQKSAGSSLHLRLAAVFTIMSLLPTVGVAIFATFTVNMGLEAWFSDRVRGVISASRSAAEAYDIEQRRALIEDVFALTQRIGDMRRSQVVYDPQTLRSFLAQEQKRNQRGLEKAFIINSDADLILRGYQNYAFDYIAPSPQQIDAALKQIVLISDWPNNQLSALSYIDGFVGHYLYATRQVDGNLLGLLDDTQQTASLYQQLEDDRGQVLFNFALVYLAFAILVIVSSVLLGLWFAERLSRPIGRLAGAAQRVGSGALDIQVIEEEGDDEISQLSRYFNNMTRQLKVQRDELIENTDKIEERRRLFDSVLSSVASGVIGLDANGRISFMNRSAQRLLDLEDGQYHRNELAYVVPEFSPLFDVLIVGQSTSLQKEVKLLRNGRLENLLVRIAPMIGANDLVEGYVIAFDDVTDLVSAQRSAAWGDVARRIAHEIKNPLTPIQLSAERIRRKFAPMLSDEREALENMTGVIVRQTNDLRRIVDEFSKFARMPEPIKRQEDLIELVRSATTLQEAGQPNVIFDIDLPTHPVMADVDATMLSQALTNLIKNAGEAIQMRLDKGRLPNLLGKVTISAVQSKGALSISISDNGIGLPQDRVRLFEPYVTTRDKGTGLGLAIVKKIIEEHGGVLMLEDSSPDPDTGHVGAKAIIELPIDSRAYQRNISKNGAYDE